MPRTKAKTGVRKYTPKRTYTRRRFYRRPRPNKLHSFNIVRECELLTITNAALSVNNYYGVVFRLDQVPNYSELVALFDSYQIDKVKVMLTPVKNQLNTGISIDTPRLHYCIDYDDGSPPGTVTEMQEYATYKVCEANRPLTIWLKPKISLQTFRTGLAEAYCRPDAYIQQHLLLDCANPDIQHYGLKFAIEPSSTANYFTYKVVAKYYFKFSGLR